MIYRAAAARLIEKLESAGSRPSKDLDADFYEMLGFEVKRGGYTAPGVTWRYFHADTSRWCAMAHVSSKIEDSVRFLPPGYRWEVSSRSGPYTGLSDAVVSDDYPVGNHYYGKHNRPEMALLIATIKSLL